MSHWFRARGSVVVKALLHVGRSQVRDSTRRMNFFFNLPNLSGRTQPLSEVSTRSRKLMFLGSRARPMRKVDNLAAICETIF
jgi:hypothetical protein